MRPMFRCLAVMVVAATALVQAADPSKLERVETVYVWPMRSALDQYLAEQLTAEDVFQVVVDPKLAKAVMTDRIDAPFLKALEEFYPQKSKDAEPKRPADSADATAGSLEAGVELGPPTNRPLGIPRGTLFLVDVASRRVLWSTYLREHDTTPNKLHEVAENVVKQLKDDLESTQ